MRASSITNSAHEGVTLPAEKGGKREVPNLPIFLANAGHGGIRGLAFMANTLVLVPLLLKSLGKEEFAMLALATPFLRYGFNGVFDFGIATGIVRHTSQSLAASDTKRANAYVSSSMALYLAFGAALICLYYLFGGALTRLLVSNSEELRDSTRIVFERGAWIYLLYSVSNPFFAVLMGIQKLEATHWIGTASLLFELGGVILLIPMGITVSKVMWVYGANGAVSLILAAFLAWRYLPSLHLSRGDVSLERIKEILGYGTQFSATTFAAILGPVIDKVILARFAGLSTVAFYEVAARLIDLLRRATQLFLLPLFPLSAAHKETHTDSERHRFYLQAFSANLIVSCALYLIPASLAFGLFQLWLGRDSRLPAIAFVVLSAAAFCQAVVGPLSMILLGTGRLKPLVVTALMALFLNLTVSPVLGVYLGFAGVLSGTLLACGLVSLTFLMWSLGIAEFAIPGSRLLRLSGPAVLAGLLPGIILTHALRLAEQPVGWLKLLFVGTIASGAFVVVSLTQADVRQMATRMFEQVASFTWARRGLSNA